jgi:TonB-dependent starch-binding outer membrane protein SusC
MKKNLLECFLNFRLSWRRRSAIGIPLMMLSMLFLEAKASPSEDVRRLSPVAFSVSGQVVTETGEPLPGVNVVEKGLNNGTVTDTEGKYSLLVSDGNATLVFSFIGYANREVAVSGRSVVDVVLTEDIQSLGEVVVIGYGTQKKSDLTGSISSIKGEDLNLMPTQRVDQALQGRAAGVMVLNTDGAPGGNTTIRIRGMNSILGGNNALIVVDGLQGVDLNTINPNDIESIEVLKDASATAIYGSRGANGVVLVTTKAGKTGTPALTYSINAGWQTLSHKLDLMNAGDYARTVNAMRATDNLNGPPNMIFTEAEIAEFDRTGGTDWQDEIYRTAPIQNHNLSLSGGTKTLKYFISGGYLDQKGILINSGYKRYTLRANFSVEVNKWLAFGLNWSGVRDNGGAPPYGGKSDNGISSFGDDITLSGPTLIAPMWPTTMPVYDAEGNYSKPPASYGTTRFNPVALARELEVADKRSQNYLNANLDFKLLKGLTLRVAGMASLSDGKKARYFNARSYDGRPQDGFVGAADQTYSEYERYQNSNILTYDKTISHHHFTVMAVAEQQYEHNYSSSSQAQKFTVDVTGLNDLGGATEVFLASFADTRTLNSYLGRINYAFKEKYLFTASYRADGSSVFGANNKWGYFPSLSVAWRLSEESFLQDLNAFSDLKLRASIGSTGNQGISPYQTQSSVTSGYNYPWKGGSKTNLGFSLSNPDNPDLRWEVTTQTNLGLDLGMFSGRLTATVDLYKKTTKDLLMYRELPLSSGFASIISNVGSIENKGLEITLGGDPLVGDFKWNTNFNISFNRNTVLDIGDNERIPFDATDGGYGINDGILFMVKGEPIGQMYGYGYQATWKESERTEAAKYGQLPGDPHYTDKNTDFRINTDDIMVIGNAIPDFIYGWTNRLSYKNFDLTLLIQGTQGNDIFNQGMIGLDTDARLLDRWTPQNQDTDIPGFIDATTRDAASLESHIEFDYDNRIQRYVEDGSYVRLKNIMLGYTVPANKLSGIGVTRIRAYVSATNAFTKTKYSGYDPEVSSYNTNDGQIGMDLGTYPSAKMLTLGLDLTF